MENRRLKAWHCFLAGYIVAVPVSFALSQWLLVLVIVWGLLSAGGIVPWWSKYKRSFAAQWGIFFGLTTGLGIIVYGP